MELTKILNRLENSTIISKTDNFSYYECSLKTDLEANFEIFSQEEYNRFNTYLNGYDWTLIIEDASYSISQNKFELLELEENLTGTQIQISIFKKGKRIVIFDEEVFSQFLKSQNLQQILDSFKNYEEGLIFISKTTLNKKATSFIAINEELLSSDESDTVISSLCNFSNFSQYKFSPNNFEFENAKNGDYLIEIIRRIHFVFNLIYLFDYSEINGDSITLKITGHKTFIYELDFQNIDVT